MKQAQEEDVRPKEHRDAVKPDWVPLTEHDLFQKNPRGENRRLLAAVYPMSGLPADEKRAARL